VFDFVWDTQGYFFWLLVISLFCFILERIVPWRKDQPALRNQFGQDIFWLIFNGHFAGMIIAYIAVFILDWINNLLNLFNLPPPEAVNLLYGTPFFVQFLAYFILSDFIEWIVHNLLHRVKVLWEFHKLHHSIIVMDWIGNFRFHWMEIVVYKSIKYFPLIIMGVQAEIIFLIAIFSTLIGNLNHSNFKTDWGILRYVINSPRLHVWHHDVVFHKKSGQNFAIVFSIWDWIFGTIYYPTHKLMPENLGFKDINEYPTDLFNRIIYPLNKLFIRKENV
jgi:sterol desaturase/sphingolipid hydroxylase (fatty acid hydroxylase superfamily)